MKEIDREQCREKRHTYISEGLWGGQVGEVREIESGREMERLGGKREMEEWERGVTG